MKTEKVGVKTEMNQLSLSDPQKNIVFTKGWSVFGVGNVCVPVVCDASRRCTETLYVISSREHNYIGNSIVKILTGFGHWPLQRMR